MLISVFFKRFTNYFSIILRIKGNNLDEDICNYYCVLIDP